MEFRNPQHGSGWHRLFCGLLAAAVVGIVSASTADAQTTQAVPSMQPGLLAGVRKVAVGVRHSCALLSNGGVLCWGDNSFGQLGNGTTEQSAIPVVVSDISGATALTASEYYACAVVAGGVKCWGRNSYGQLGDGTNRDRVTPVDVPGIANATAVVSGDGHTCVLVGDGEAGTNLGKVKCWGRNDHGQIGDGTTEYAVQPVDVIGLNGVTALTAGDYHTCGVAGGGVLCWGWNMDGQLGDGTLLDHSMAMRVDGVAGAKDVAAGNAHTCALLAGGSVLCWGRNDLIGGGTPAVDYTAAAVPGISGATAISAGGGHTCVITETGGMSTLKCWGNNYSGELGAGGGPLYSLAPVDIPNVTGATAVAAGWAHSCAVANSSGGGIVKCWGQNDFGQLGNGVVSYRTTPVDIGGISGATAIGSGGTHNCAVVANRVLKCWGWNMYGQLGGGTATLGRVEPLEVQGIVNPISVAPNGGYTCVLANSSVGGAETAGVKCWGRNVTGQLGDGTVADSVTPVDVNLIAAPTSLAAGGSGYTCAIAGDIVQCWGLNLSGQLGYDPNYYYYKYFPSPASVPGLNYATALAAGEDHNCALLNEGVKCLGSNRFGQLGDGSKVDRIRPVDVLGISGVTAVAAGGYHTCALIAGSGTVKCWGGNATGALGDGTSTERLAPVNVVGVNGVTALAAGREHTCALMGSGSGSEVGSVKCWGRNDHGQLGDGTTIDRSTASSVVEIRGATAIAAHGDVTCALISGAGTVKCWGDNRFGQLGLDPGWTPVDVVAPVSPIVGRISDSSGRPIPGVQVTIIGAIPLAPTFTDASGIYTLTISAPGQYVVTPTKPHSFSFSPTSAQLETPAATSGPSFVGSLSPSFMPVIFIPGITGSVLRSTNALLDSWPGWIPGSDHTLLGNRPSDQGRDTIVALDAVRTVAVKYGVYKPLLDALSADYSEYQVAGLPERRTAGGCDLAQASADPRLFVFAYDWRRSNVQSAVDLRGYIGCIQRLYPGAKINVVAHSMGGLVLRRYVLDAIAGGYEHHLRRVITIATPWLGAPKFLEVLEFGRLGIPNLIIGAREVQRLLEAFPGAHELLPSSLYFEYAYASGKPDVLKESTWDMNEDGATQQIYGYDELMAMVNLRYPRQHDCENDNVCRVGTNNRSFHERLGQDTWGATPDGIEYYYVVGNRRKVDTPVGFEALYDVLCDENGDVCWPLSELDPIYSRGDEEVPLVSALRAPGGQVPDGNVKAVYVVTGDEESHLGITQDPVVQNLVKGLLRGGAGVGAALAPGVITEAGIDDLPPAEPAYYISGGGVGAASITNEQGQVTGVTSDLLPLSEAAEVSYLLTGESGFAAVVPAAGVYTLTLASTETPMRLAVVRQGAGAADYAARLRDLVLPRGRTLQLRLTPNGVADILYDSNGDGGADSPVSKSPLVVQGPLAADNVGPEVRISVIATTAGRGVSITATDAPAGVQSVRYSFDGRHYQPYTRPLLAPSDAERVYAFADDTLANRSPLVSVALGSGQDTEHLYLPKLMR